VSIRMSLPEKIKPDCPGLFRWNHLSAQLYVETRRAVTGPFR